MRKITRKNTNDKSKKKRNLKCWKINNNTHQGMERRQFNKLHVKKNIL